MNTYRTQEHTTSYSMPHSDSEFIVLLMNILSKLRKNELDYISEDEDEYMQYGSDDEPEMLSDDTGSPKLSQVDSTGDDEDMPEW